MPVIVSRLFASSTGTQVQEAEAAWRVEGSARAGFKVFRRKEHTNEGPRFAVQACPVVVGLRFGLFRLNRCPFNARRDGQLEERIVCATTGKHGQDTYQQQHRMSDV